MHLKTLDVYLRHRTSLVTKGEQRSARRLFKEQRYVALAGSRGMLLLTLVQYLKQGWNCSCRGKRTISGQTGEVLHYAGYPGALSSL